MINNETYNTPVIRGGNTFRYQKDISYKHFFVFADHASYFQKDKREYYYPLIGQYIIPNEIIKQSGFGFYSRVETMRNDKLWDYDMPLPEIIIDQNDFKKEYLYKVASAIYSDFVIKKLSSEDNEKYNEPIEEYFLYDGRGKQGRMGYLDYSYADIYYELVYQLARKHDCDVGKIVRILKTMNLHAEIENYFKKNHGLFRRQTEKYLKTKTKH